MSKGCAVATNVYSNLKKGVDKILIAEIGTSILKQDILSIAHTSMCRSVMFLLQLGVDVLMIRSALVKHS